MADEKTEIYASIIRDHVRDAVEMDGAPVPGLLMFDLMAGLGCSLAEFDAAMELLKARGDVVIGINTILPGKKEG